jgi:hypothetical protein
MTAAPNFGPQYHPCEASASDFVVTNTTVIPRLRELLETFTAQDKKSDFYGRSLAVRLRHNGNAAGFFRPLVLQTVLGRLATHPTERVSAIDVAEDVSAATYLDVRSAAAVPYICGFDGTPHPDYPALDDRHDYAGKVFASVYHGLQRLVQTEEARLPAPSPNTPAA